MHEEILKELAAQVSELTEAYKQLGPQEELQDPLVHAEIKRLSDVSALVQRARLQREKMNQLFDRPNQAYDSLAMNIYGTLEKLVPDERRSARELLSDQERASIRPYYWRTHWLSMEERSAERALSGLCIYAFDKGEVSDYRDVLCELAPAHVCIRQLACEPADLFAKAASFASVSLAKILRTFGQRADVTAAAFGWKIASTPYGPRYRQNL